MNTRKLLAALFAFALAVAAVLWMVTGIVDRVSKHEHDWLEVTTARVEQKI